MRFNNKFLIAVLLVLTALTFVNSLGNGFIGDDEALFTINSFYHSWENFPRLFTPDYSTDTNDASLYLSSDIQNIGSGSVAYRPVLSTTYFIDYALWQKNPFGYHLTNLILHLMNTVLVFVIASLILKNSGAAFLGGALFALHPVRSEAVCNIGYRADMVACLFVLLCFYFYIRWRNEAQDKTSRFFPVSVVCFFLAVFSKESAVVMPAGLLLYDILLKRETVSAVLKSWQRYLPYFAVAASYVFLYLMVFPNSTMAAVQLIGGTWATHVQTMIVIFGQYLWDMIWPFTIRLLPPLYSPPPEQLTLLNMILSLGALVVVLGVIARSIRGGKVLAFFLLWFLVFMLPVSNIVTLPNAMAHRFLYLPSIGFFIALAIFLDRILSGASVRFSLPSLKVIGQSGMILGCLLMTFPMNYLWKNNPTYIMTLVRDYPQNSQIMVLAGLVHGKAGQLEEAAKYYERALELGSVDPRLLFELGVAYAKKDPSKALQLYEQAVQFYPGMAPFYTGAARVSLFLGIHEKALSYAQKSIELAPGYQAYGYAIQALLLRDRIDAAREFLRKAESDLPGDRGIASLRRMFDENVALPVDIGY